MSTRTVSSQVIVASFVVVLAIMLVKSAPKLALAADNGSQCERRDIADGDTSAVPDSGVFVRHNSSYPFRTLSTWSYIPNSSANFCFIYNIINASAVKLESVKWEDAGFLRTDIPANGRVSKAQQEFSRHEQPEIAVANLAAFEKSKAKSKAFFSSEYISKQGLPVVPVQHKKTKQGVLEFQNFDYAQNPLLQALLAPAQLDTRDVVAFHAPTDGAGSFPQIRSAFYLDNVAIETISEARWEKDGFVVLTKLSLTNKTGGSVILFVPALSALEKAFGEELTENSLARFITLAREFRNAPVRLADQAFTSTLRFRPSKAVSGPPLYVMKHPVTISGAGTGTSCVLVSSYGPVPMTMLSNFCSEK